MHISYGVTLQLTLPFWSVWVSLCIVVYALSPTLTWTLQDNSRTTPAPGTYSMAVTVYLTDTIPKQPQYCTNTVVTLIVVIHSPPQPCHSVSLAIYKSNHCNVWESFHIDLSTPVELLPPTKALLHTPLSPSICTEPRDERELSNLIARVTHRVAIPAPTPPPRSKSKFIHRYTLSLSLSPSSSQWWRPWVS